MKWRQLSKTPHLNPRTRQPTGSHSLLPGVHYGARACRAAVAWQAGCVTPRLPRPPPASARPRAGPRASRPTSHQQPQRGVGTAGRSDPAETASQRQRSHSLRGSARAPRAATAEGEGCTKPGESWNGSMCSGSRAAAAAPEGRLAGGSGWSGGPAGPRIRCAGVAAAPRGASGKRPLASWPRTPAPPRAAIPRKRMWRSGGCGGGGTGSASPQRWSASLTPHRWERDRTGKAGRVASRESLARRPPPPPPCRGRRGRRCRCDRAHGLSAPLGNTLFHTRPTHSGNGKERPPSAQALGKRARSPALSPSPAQIQRSRTAQAPKADNEKGLCRGSQPLAFPAAYCAGVPHRPTWTIKRTPGLAGTATDKDYNSQRAVRQVQAEVGLLGMLGFVVSAFFHTQLFGRFRTSFSCLFGRFDKCRGWRV